MRNGDDMTTESVNLGIDSTLLQVLAITIDC